MLARVGTGTKLFVALVASGVAACSSSNDEGPIFNFGGSTNDAGAGSTAAGGVGGGIGVAGQLNRAGAPMITVPVPVASGGSGGATSAPSGGANTGGRTVTEKCASSMASSVDMKSVRPADIIVAIDTSSSMGDEIKFTQTEMNRFSEQIVASGIDVRVIMIADRQAPEMAGTAGAGGSAGAPGGGFPKGGGMQQFGICIGAPLGSGQCPEDTNPPRYVHVPERVGSNDALSRIISTYDLWREHLRPNATKSFVVITDDDAVGGNMTANPVQSATGFVEGIRARDPMMFQEFTYNSVYSFTRCTQAIAIGTVHRELVELTKGVAGDLCEQNFTPVFDKLAQQIIETSGSSIACEWALPAAPATGQAFSGDLVQVERTTAMGASKLPRVPSQGDCGAGGWYLDSVLNPTQIIACPNTCMEMQNQSGGKIDITFGCEAVGGCVETGAATVSDDSPGACDWAIPAAPEGQSIDYKSVNVRYTSASGFAARLGIVNSEAECAMVQNGWYYDNPLNPKRILSCPQTCTDVKAGGAQARVEVLFGCETLPAPIR